MYGPKTKGMASTDVLFNHPTDSRYPHPVMQAMHSIGTVLSRPMDHMPSGCQTSVDV